jgi:NAD(P)-dependent dehydrogenase (short-subunit alcohol dehydrogenase family)
MGPVSGKVALVTGSGAGIGRAAALKFAEEAGKVIVSDIESDEGNETAALIKQNGGDAVFARADATESADVEALIATVVDAYGQFDCACNNAGIEGKIAPLLNSLKMTLIGDVPKRQAYLSLLEIRDRVHAQEMGAVR